MELPRQEYWSGLPFSIPVINLTSLALPALVGRFFLPLCQLVSPFELYLRLCEPFKHYSEKAMAPNSTTLAWKIPWTEGWWAVVHEVAKSQTRLSNFTFTFHFHVLEKEMATHSSILTWKIPWMEEPGGLQSMGSLRVGHN